MSCISGKRQFFTEQLAEDVLIELWENNEYASGRGPVAIYKCDDCGYYHLTSKGPMNSKLAEALAEGKLKLQREAHRWLDKWKRK